jgi:exosortase A
MIQRAVSAMLNDQSHVVHSWSRALVALLLLISWIFYLYRDTAIGMASIWSRSETFTHGFLVPPITLWLVWRQRRVIAVHKPQPLFMVMVAVAFAAFVWLLGDLVAINAVTQLAFVSLLVLAVPATLGWAITRLIFFPLSFLFFAVPLGEFLLPQLMTWTANFTVIALRISGVPVYREGLQFVIPSGNWSVVEACSGVRYLIASLTVGTLFAYLNYQSFKRRLLFVLISILVPIVANWLRAYMIVMLGHFSGNELAVGVDHLIYGWVFFGIVITLMFVIGARWAEPRKASIPNTLDSPTSTRATPERLWLLAASFALLVALPQVILSVIRQSEGPAHVSLEAPASLAGDWRVVDEGLLAFKPRFQNPSAEINCTYGRHDGTVGLYLAYYRQQNYSRKLISSNNVLVTSNDRHWAQVARARRELVLGGKPVDLRVAELRAPGLVEQPGSSRLLVWRVYWVNGFLTSNDYLAKIYSAYYQLTGRGDDSAVIVVYTPKGKAGAAEALLESFLMTNYVSINDLFFKVRAKV